MMQDLTSRKVKQPHGSQAEELSLLSPLPTEKTRRPDYTALIAAVALLPVYIAFYLRGQEELGRSVSFVLMMTAVAIRIRWDLRKRVWFWVVIASVLALHVPLLFLLRWPEGWLPAIGTLPLGLADLLIYLGVVAFIEKFILKTSPAEV